MNQQLNAGVPVPVNVESPVPVQPLSKSGTQVRTANYQKCEKFLLLELMSRHPDQEILMSKKMDSKSLRMRNEFWHKIAIAFNSGTSNTPRTVQNLKSLWKNLRTKTRRELAAINSTASEESNIDDALLADLSPEDVANHLKRNRKALEEKENGVTLEVISDSASSSPSEGSQQRWICLECDAEYSCKPHLDIHQIDKGCRRSTTHESVAPQKIVPTKTIAEKMFGLAKEIQKLPSGGNSSSELQQDPLEDNPSAVMEFSLFENDQSAVSSRPTQDVAEIPENEADTAGMGDRDHNLSCGEKISPVVKIEHNTATSSELINPSGLTTDVTKIPRSVSEKLPKNIPVLTVVSSLFQSLQQHQPKNHPITSTPYKRDSKSLSDTECMLPPRSKTPRMSSDVDDSGVQTMDSSNSTTFATNSLGATEATTAPVPEEHPPFSSRSRVTDYASISAVPAETSRNKINKVWKCQPCGIVFPDNIMFGLHKACHTANNPYKCNICSKVCDDKYDFTFHITMGDHE